jgi:potassium-dependent mechanosensitive channel
MVSNFVSGLILAFEHPIQVGDTLEIGSLLGRVQRIGFRASVIRTFDGAEVIIPNGELVWGQVINWSLSDRVRRIEVSVGVAYGTDPNRVLEILRGVAEKHPAVLRYPPADALFERFGDSSLDFKLRCWVSVDDFYKVRSELAVGINDAFKEAGITIPFPQRDIHVIAPSGPVD